MQWENIIFLILAIGLVSSALAAVSSKRILRSAIFLAIALLFTAFIYLLLGAELLAGIQILLYAGGVITLIIFALLISEKLGNQKSVETHHGVIPALTASSLVLFILLYVTWSSPRIQTLSNSKSVSEYGLSRTLSEVLFSNWALPLEILSVLLLAAIIGALVLARQEKTQGEDGEQ